MHRQLRLLPRQRRHDALLLRRLAQRAHQRLRHVGADLVYASARGGGPTLGELCEGGRQRADDERQRSGIRSGDERVCVVVAEGVCA